MYGEILISIVCCDTGLKIMSVWLSFHGFNKVVTGIIILDLDNAFLQRQKLAGVTFAFFAKGMTA
jgi:hypothetical protein